MEPLGNVTANPLWGGWQFTLALRKAESNLVHDSGGENGA